MAIYKKHLKRVKKDKQMGYNTSAQHYQHGVLQVFKF